MAISLNEISVKLPMPIVEILKKDIVSLRPCQEKAVHAGLLEGKNLLVCTPTASGKTLIAEMACLTAILSRKGKAVYIVPLKALANEKFKDFTRRWGSLCSVCLSIGDVDDHGPILESKDFIICTAEKLDAVMRHRAQWVSSVACVVIDEIHLLNDPGRGPTLEILITMLRTVAKQNQHVQFIGLSATIGNPQELADWLDAELIVDDWRPSPLFKGVYYDGRIEFEEP